MNPEISGMNLALPFINDKISPLNLLLFLLLVFLAGIAMSAKILCAKK